ncbi:MAG: HIT family protein [Coraliomargaritaceae bacterium]
MDSESHSQTDRLHAYWRMPYIKANSKKPDSSNPFANLKDADEFEHFILVKGTYTCILLNLYPYNAGHLLVLTYREVSDISDLNPDEQKEFMEFLIKSKSILSEALNPDGFNIGFNLGKAAGAGIPKHLHCHVVPRWEGDHNFMPVISNTRVLPESIEEMWKQLKNFS